MKSKMNVFTIIGIVIAAVAAVAGIAYLVYRYVGKRYLTDDCCYEYDYEDCDCDNCCDCGEGCDCGEAVAE